MRFLCRKKGNRESGSNTLFISTISNSNFFTANGRYPNKVGAEKIIIIP
jgi:hypothetical protein